MPAEWHRQSRVWVTRPHNLNTWPNCLEDTQEQFDVLVQKLSQRVEVCDTQQMGIATDDSWIRDFGPIFVFDSFGMVVALDFGFNNWGEKYTSCQQDVAAGSKIARTSTGAVSRHDWVLEGGAIEVNGCGTAIAGTSCLLDPRRNGPTTRDQISHMLAESIDVQHVIWLTDGIMGDDTDGHVDNVARFVNPQTIVAPWAPESHPDHGPLKRNWHRLSQARDQDGRHLDIVALPVPQPMRYTFPPEPEYDIARRQLPASYANFLISNGAVFLPVFGQPSDDEAVRVLDRAMLHHTIVPIRSEHLLVGLGTIHCLTLHQPG